jgi:UTP-glucose-1-phosphate uridylyltransferase
MKPTLVILAAGMGSRYGGLKQLDGVGPNQEVIIEYSIYDAIRAGFEKVVFVIRKDIEKAFRDTFGNKFKDKIEVAYAFQAIDSPVEGLNDIPLREKPWGTGHAVLVAQHLVDTPFAVINADDYYGISAFESMANFLINDCTPEHYAMIGFQLDKTLSDAGHVNRGICYLNEHGHLTDVVERHKISRRENGVITFEEDGALHELAPDALVSMNLWGFHPNIFEITRHRFLQFVAEHQDQPRAEFYIPLVINELIKTNQIDLKVIPNAEKWYGVTYKEDKEMVVNAFNELITNGAYPSNLWNN